MRDSRGRARHRLSVAARCLVFGVELRVSRCTIQWWLSFFCVIILRHFFPPPPEVVSMLSFACFLCAHVHTCVRDCLFVSLSECAFLDGCGGLLFLFLSSAAALATKVTGHCALYRQYLHCARSPLLRCQVATSRTADRRAALSCPGKFGTLHYAATRILRPSFVCSIASARALLQSRANGMYQKRSRTRSAEYQSRKLSPMLQSPAACLLATN